MKSKLMKLADKWLLSVAVLLALAGVTMMIGGATNGILWKDSHWVYSTTCCLLLYGSGLCYPAKRLLQQEIN